MVRHLSPVRPKMHFNNSSQVYTSVTSKSGKLVLLPGILKRSTPKKLLVSPWLQQWYKQCIHVVKECRGQVWNFGPKSSNPSLWLQGASRSSRTTYRKWTNSMTFATKLGRRVSWKNSSQNHPLIEGQCSSTIFLIDFRRDKVYHTC
jgi:hypothetical protein